MKAKDFWEFLCEKSNYRFFAGVPCKGLMPLYKTMHPKLMHYIPAVREGVALSMASGAMLAGQKSAVLMDLDRLYNTMDYIMSFNKAYGIPVLIIAFDSTGNEYVKKLMSTHKIPYSNVKNIKKDITALIKRMNKHNTPGVAILSKGVIK